MEGGRHDPLLSVPTAWRLAGSPGGSPRCRERRRLQRPRMALAVDQGQESLWGQRVKYTKPAHLHSRWETRSLGDGAAPATLPVGAAEGRACSSGGWK